jgi:hypothetical protein
VKCHWFATVFAVVSSPALAQVDTIPPGPVPPAAAAQPPAPMLHPAPVLLKRDTPVAMMATKEISTADVSAGTRFKLRVNQPVTVAGKVVIPIGATAFGEVISAEDSGGLGKSGRMTAKLLYVQLGDAMIPLDGETSAKGTGAGSAGVAFLFTGWVALFHRGNNAKIKAGEMVGGFIAQDTWLDLGATPVQRVAAPAQPPVAPLTQPAQAPQS